MPDTRSNVGTAIGEGEPISRRDRVDPNAPDICAKRDRLLGGLVDKPELQAILKKSKRTVDRLIALGMPHTELFGQSLFDLEAVREWISEGSRLAAAGTPASRPTAALSAARVSTWPSERGPPPAKGAALQFLPHENPPPGRAAIIE